MQVEVKVAKAERAAVDATSRLADSYCSALHSSLTGI